MKAKDADGDELMPAGITEQHASDGAEDSRPAIAGDGGQEFVRRTEQLGAALETL